ncbi:MAG TPA: ABC transporter [Gammaproteobacteria bacterium]|nr:ABC transporter [Gammaproteobacteria bacterium]|tara:strand:+ start:2885 stop:3610 length:726 start_codon:yes stop_codon:yes gene_type:complete
MISAKGLAKSFGDVDAVKDVSFNASNGQVTGLLGPNGAGKSTTLRIIYGLLRQDAGVAAVDGVDILNETRKAQGLMGVLSDTHGLYIRLTAREHIHYFGRLHGIDENTLEKSTDELLRLLDMQSIADRRVEGFSQGEKTKVCLARALIHDPPNVLLDEPTNGLDVMTTRSVRDLIAELKNRDICVTFSSHMMHEVSRLCDQIVIISEGTVVASGTTDEIRSAAQEDNLEEAFVKLVETVID